MISSSRIRLLDSTRIIAMTDRVENRQRSIESAIPHADGLSLVQLCPRQPRTTDTPAAHPAGQDAGTQTAVPHARVATAGAECDPSGQTNIWSSLHSLNQAQDLERHLNTRRNSQGQVEAYCESTAVHANGCRTTIIHTATSLRQAINQHYLESMRAAADSEPARQNDLERVNGALDILRKRARLDHVPTSEELAKMLAPAQRAKLQPQEIEVREAMQQLRTVKQDLVASGLDNVRQGYESFLERTGQTRALQVFQREKRLQETMPFQNWLGRIESGSNSAIRIGHVDIDKNTNPFSTREIATSYLERTPVVREMAEANFQRAIRQADQIDQKTVAKELERIRVEKTKVGSDRFELAILNQQEKTLTLLSAAPALCRTAYADYLLTQGDKNGAFAQLMQATDNPIGVAFIDHQNKYFEQLVDKSMHGDKNTLAQIKSAAGLVEASNDHFQRGLALSKSAAERDQVQAKAEFEAAKEAAHNAAKQTGRLDTEALRENAKQLDRALNAESNKPVSEQNQEKLKALRDQRDAYKYLSHIPALACLKEAKADFALASIQDRPPNAEESTAMRSSLNYASGDHALDEVPGATQQLKALYEMVRTKNFGERALAWVERNAGTITAVSVGFTVSSLSCWSGPGALIAGAAAGAAAGTAVDYLCGNELTLETFGGHAFDGLGGGISQKITTHLTGTVLKNARPWLVRTGTASAATAGRSAIENIPTAYNEGPLSYSGKVLNDTAVSALLGYAKVKSLPIPGFTRAIKDGAREIYSQVAADP